MIASIAWQVIPVRGTRKDLDSMPPDRFVESLRIEYASRNAVLGVKP